MDKIISKYYPHIHHCTLEDIIFEEEVRSFCKENKCHKYNSSWCCPPAIGEVSKYIKLVKKYSNVIIFYETLECNTLDKEEPYQKMKIFQDKSISLKQELKELGYDFLIYGAGTCMICKKCTYPTNPCVNPDKPVISMEAIGMNVFKTLQKNKLEYPNIPNTMTYYGCIFY